MPGIFWTPRVDWPAGYTTWGSIQVTPHAVTGASFCRCAGPGRDTSRNEAQPSLQRVCVLRACGRVSSSACRGPQGCCLRAPGAAELGAGRGRDVTSDDHAWRLQGTPGVRTPKSAGLQTDQKLWVWCKTWTVAS